MCLAMAHSCQQRASGQPFCGNWASNLWTSSPEKIFGGKHSGTITADGASSVTACSLSNGRTISHRTRTLIHFILPTSMMDAAQPDQGSKRYQQQGAVLLARSCAGTHVEMCTHARLVVSGAAFLASISAPTSLHRHLV